jgi:nicotinamidase-related amidase
MTPELLDVNRSIVVVIDLQGKLMEMIHRPRLVIDSTIRLLKMAELFRVPVVLTEQYPRGLGPTHPEVRAAYDALESPKYYLEKEAFGCCGDPNFEPALGGMRPDVPAERRQIVIAGIEAHVCVTQTVVELLRSGQSVFLCWECVSGRGEEYRQWALKRMQQAGAVITNHESVCFEWARDKNHPQFKALNNLLKSGQLV